MSHSETAVAKLIFDITTLFKCAYVLNSSPPALWINQSKHISSLFRPGSLDNSRRCPKIQKAEHGLGQEKSVHEITDGVPSSSIWLCYASQIDKSWPHSTYATPSLNSKSRSTDLLHTPHGQTCPDRLELTSKRGTMRNVFSCTQLTWPWVAPRFGIIPSTK